MTKKKHNPLIRSILSKLGYFVAGAIVLVAGFMALIFKGQLNGDIGIALFTFVLALILIEATKKDF